MLVCRPPVGDPLGSRDGLQAPSSGLSSASLCFHLWLSADFPCTPRPLGVVCPHPGPVPCIDPHPLCDPLSHSSGEEARGCPSSTPALSPHRPGSHSGSAVPLGSAVAASLGEEMGVFLTPEVPRVCWSSWLCPGIEAKHGSLLQSCGPQRAPRGSSQHVEVVSAKRLGKGPLGLGLLYSLLDDRWGGGAVSGRGLNSMAQAGHGAGDRPIRALGKATNGCPPI